MEPNRSTFDIQQAWQTAFLLRTCPSDAVLRSTVPDENLTRHLASCALCREKRAMPAEETGAWQKLFNAFAPQVHKAVNKPQAGQVWVLRKELARWGNDGYFYAPPNVLLLDVPEDTQNLHIAQLYTDKRLMGDGDVWLGDQFGFAQSWNCYSIPRNALECWLGAVSESLVSEVVSKVAMNMQPPAVDSIISFFREMETAVGLNAVQAMEAVKAAESSQNEAFLQNIFGTIADAYKKLSGFKLSDYADSLLDLLSTARDPQAITPVIAATSIPLQVNIVIKQRDGAITIKTVGATLTESNWDDGDYYVAGKLQESQQEDLFLVASLNLDGNIVCECQSSIEAGSPFFDIVFQSVAKEASAIDNLKFILVRP